jgi:addiction module RelE/StbE family toxin
MNIEFGNEAKKKLQYIKKTNSKLYNKIRERLLIFEQNPKHPSLRLHRLKGELKEAWSISIERNFRMLYFIDGKTATFFKIGTHEEVYKK